MKTIIIALAVLVCALPTNAGEVKPVVSVSCFRNTDGALVCQIKKKTYGLREFLKELPALGDSGLRQSCLRLTVALDFPAGQLLDVLAAAQEAGFSQTQIVRPNSLPHELVSRLPKTELRIQLLGWTTRDSSEGKQSDRE